MRSPLETRIAALRGQVRRLLALHGLSWVVAGVVLAILGAGLLDWLFHLAREVRLALLVGLVGLTGWLLYRHVITPLIVRFGDLDIALRIERRWPGLQDRLATTLQFLQLRDAGAGTAEDVRGSRQLRDATIERTLAEVEAIDFREVVDARPARAAMRTAAVPLALGLVLLAAAPGACRTALSRLFAPFGAAQWPKQTHLAVLEPARDGQKVARGEPIRLEVGVGADEVLPSTGTVTYTFADGEVLTRRLGSLAPDRATGVGAKFVDRIAEAGRSFSYTIQAGDDATAPRSVVVVPPPSLAGARVTLTPPAYTGEPESLIEPAAGRPLPGSELRLDNLVVGTRVAVTARANKPIAEAQVSLLGAAPWVRPAPSTPVAAPTGDPAAAATPTPALAEAPAPTVRLADGGRELVTEFVVEAPGAFQLTLLDTEGFRGQQREAVRFDVSAVPDTVPQVTLVDPPGNRDVTVAAVVPVVIEAEDDFGLGKVWIDYRVSYGGSEPEQSGTLVLWVPDAPAEGDGPAHAPDRKRQVRYDWDLGAASANLALRPGATITFHAAAVDLDTRQGPKTGKSRELQLRVLEPEKIAEQLEEQRRQIREEIARTLDVQKQALTPVEEARRTLRQVPQLDAEGRERVRTAEVTQRQVTSRIADPADGLRRKVERYLEDQQNLKIDNPEAGDQMKGLLAGLDRIREDHLVAAEQDLDRATKALDEAAAADPQAGGPRPDDPADPKTPAAGEPSKTPKDQAANPDRKGQPDAGAQPTRPDAPAGQPTPKGDPADRQGSQPKGQPEPGGAGTPKAQGDPKGGEAAKAEPPPEAQGAEAAGDGAKPEGADTPKTKGDPAGGEPKGGQSPQSKGAQAPQTKGGQPPSGGEPAGAQPQPEGAAPDPAGGEPKGGQTPPGGAKPQGGQPQGAQPQGGQPQGAQPQNEPTKAGQDLARAEGEQKAIADELKGMLEKLGEFETMRGMTQEAKGLLKEQQEANQAAQEAAEKHALDGKAAEALPPEARADVENAAARQAKVAEGLRQFENKLDEQARRLAGEDPLAAQALEEAAAGSRQRDTAGKAEQAGQQLGQNQTGRAREAQKEVERDLKRLVDSLQNRRENDLRRLAQALKDAGKDLQGLRKQQALNRLKTEQAKAMPDAQQRAQELAKLAKEQQQLEQDLRRQLAKLRKLQVDTQRAGQRASEKMSKARQQQEQDDADEAMEQQDEALADLEDVQEQVDEAQQEAEEQLAMEQLSRIKDDLANLGKRQQELTGEVAGYGEKLGGDGLTLPQKKSVVGLGRAEEAIGEEAKDLAEQLDAAPVYAQTLERAAKAMAEASKRLRSADPGPQTQAELKLATRRIEQLLDALKPDQAGAGGQQGGGQQPGGGGGQGGGGGDGIPAVAQLKILKVLQEEINDRTQEIATIQERKKALTPEQEAELAGLKDEQRNVADLARDLTRPKRDDGEE